MVEPTRKVKCFVDKVVEEADSTSKEDANSTQTKMKVVSFVHLRAFQDKVKEGFTIDFYISKKSALQSTKENTQVGIVKIHMPCKNICTRTDKEML